MEHKRPVPAPTIRAYEYILHRGLAVGNSNAQETKRTVEKHRMPEDGRDGMLHLSQVFHQAQIACAKEILLHKTVWIDPTLNSGSMGQVTEILPPEAGSNELFRLKLFQSIESPAASAKNTMNTLGVTAGTSILVLFPA